MSYHSNAKLLLGSETQAELSVFRFFSFDRLRKINRRSFIGAVGAMLVANIPSPSKGQRGKAQETEAVGAVEDARGEAFAEAREKRRQLERASPIFVKDLVGTGADSRLWLRLGTNTSIQLGERARLIIDRFLINAGGEITVEAGAMFFEKRAPDRSGTVKVRSSYGLMEVRGTRFFAGPSNKVFGVFVEEGILRVSAGGRQVILRAGQGTDIAQPGARPTAPRQWGQGRIQAAYASVR